MPIFTEGLPTRNNTFLDEYSAGLGESLGQTAKETLIRSPVASIFRAGELAGASDPGGYAVEDTFDPMTGMTSPAYEVPKKRMFSQDEAADRAKTAGVKLEFPKDGITEDAFNILVERKQDEMRRQDIMARGPSGFLPGVAKFGTAFGASLLDPINIASAFVPVVGQARYAQLLASAGRSTLARTLPRLGVGAAEGLVGAAMVEPIIYGAARYEQADYGMADSALNVAFGGVFGGGLHVLGGSGADAFRAWKGRADPFVRLQGLSVDQIKQVREVEKLAEAGIESPEQLVAMVKTYPPEVLRAAGLISDAMPADAPVAAPRGTIFGEDTDIRIGERYVPAQWAVVDLADVEATMTKADNQWRDRTRVASDVQIRKIANDPDFEQLQWSPIMDFGAPTLSKDGRVIGGNGRVMGVSTSYDIGRVGPYRDKLNAALERFGIDAASIEGMSKPMLVRLLREDVDVKKAAILSNEGGSARMSALEQAGVDADRLGDFRGFDIPESGDLNTAANRGAIRQWVGKFPENQQAELVTAEGYLSPQGLLRLRNAILHRAYGDSPVLKSLIEGTDEASTNLTKALTRVAGTIADARGAMARGDLHNLDISTDLQVAVAMLKDLRSKGLDFDGYMAQGDMARAPLTPEQLQLLRFLDDNIASPRAIADLVTSFYDQLRREGDPKQGSLLGDAPAPTKEALLDRAMDQVAEDGSAVAKVEKLSAETREAALRVSVAQMAEGRGVEITPIAESDPSIRTMTPESAKAAAERAASVDNVLAADVQAAEAVEARAAAPKSAGLEAAEKAAEDALAVAEDVAARGNDAYKYARGYHGAPTIFAPDTRGELGGFRWDKINTGEGAQAFGYGHYIAMQEWIAKTRYRDRLVDRMRANAKLTIEQDGKTVTLTGGETAYKLQNGRIVHQDFGPEERAYWSVIDKLRNGTDAAQLRENLDFELMGQRENLAELERGYTVVRRNKEWVVLKFDGKDFQSGFKTKAEAVAVQKQRNEDFRRVTKDYGPKYEAKVLELEASLRALDELTVELKGTPDEIMAGVGLEIVREGRDVRVRGEDGLFVAVDKSLLKDGYRMATPEEAAAMEKARAAENGARRIPDPAIEEIKPGADLTGSVYTVDIPDELVGRMLVWDAPLREQPEAVRAAFARFGIVNNFLDWQENGNGGLWVEIDGVNVLLKQNTPDGGVFIYKNGYEQHLVDNYEQAKAYVDANYGLSGNATGESVYRRLANMVAEQDDRIDPDAIMEAGIEAQMRRGMYEPDKFPDGGDFDYAPHPEEIASIMLEQAGVPGLRFLDGTARRGGNWNDPDASFNYVVFGDDTAKLVARYMRGDAVGPANADNLTEALRLAFGDSTETLLESGRVKIVDDVTGIPDGPHPADVKGATAPDGTVYIVAKNVTADEAKGLLIHEVGEHVGMEQMLGADLYAKTLAQVAEGIARGDEAFVKAAAMVPAGTKAEHVAAEQLAYLVQHAPELSLVQRIIAAVRAWAYKTFKIAQDNMELTEADFRALAVSSLHAVARADRQAVQSARLATAFSRMVPVTETMAFKKWFKKSQAANDDGTPLDLYHGTQSDYSVFDASKTQRLPGFWMTTSVDSANGYAGSGDGANVMLVYASIQKPRVFNVGDEPFTKAWADYESGDFDGFIMKSAGKIEAVVAQNSEQIKSKFNRGTFAGPDMRYSRDGQSGPDVKAEMRQFDEAIKRAELYTAAVRAAAERLGDPNAARSAMDAASGGNLTATEIDDLLAALRAQNTAVRNRLRKARDAVTAEDDAAVMQSDAMKAADELANNITMAAVIEKRNGALNLAARTKALTFVMSEFKGNEAEGLKALLAGSQLKRRGARMSVDAEQKSFEGEWLGGIIAEMERENLWRLFTSETMARETARALYLMGDPKADMGGLPKEAVKMAEIIHRYQEDARNTQNRFGAWIRDMKGYIVRQTHDMFRIRAEGFQAWRDYVLPRIDLDKTFYSRGVTDIEAGLREMWANFSAGQHMKFDPDEELAAAFPGMGKSEARKQSQSRVLYFKDGDNWFDYNERFGAGRFADSVLGGLERASRSAALMKVLGTNPKGMLSRLMDEIEDGLRAEPEARARFHEQRKSVQNLFAHVDGSANIPGSHMGAQISSGLRAWQSMAKLGGAVISSITDIPVYASEQRFQGRGLLSGMADALGGLMHGRGSKDQQQILSSLGVFFDSMRNGVARRFDAQENVGGRTSKLMQQFFKWNGLTWWTEVLRGSSALSLSHNLAQNTSAPWGNLSPDLRNMLSLYNIDEAKWDLVRMATTREADGRMYLTPEGVAGVPRAALENYITGIGRTVSDASVQNLVDDLSGALRALYIDRAEHAVIEPDARTRALLLRGTNPGTVWGEIARFVAQFKSFPVAMLQKTMGREIYGRGYDTLGQYLKNGKGDMLGLAHMMLWLTVFGYGAMSAKDMLKGRSPRDPLAPATWMAAFVQGGGAGIYGDFIFGEMRNRFGGGVLNTVAGPVLGTAEDIMDLYGRVKAGDDAAAKAFRVAVNNTPFLNMFYTRMALDYLLLYNIQEQLNPGYLRRMERRIEKENGQTFLIKPSEVVR